LWNAARFVLGHVEAGRVPADGGYPEDPGPEAAWILGRLRAVVDRFDQLSDEYRFSDAYGLLYNFAWSEAFDWYLELSKAALEDEASAAETRQTLGVVLRDLLKLFHPAIPYLTEELWKEVVADGLLAGAAWPDPPVVAVPPSMEVFQELVGGVRRFRSSHQLSPRQELHVQVADPESVAEDWWPRQLASLVAVVPEVGEPDSTDGFTRIVAGPVQGFVPLEGVVDLDAERARLERSLAGAEEDFALADRKLSNPKFRDRAPADIVAKEEQKRTEAEATIAKLRSQLAEL
ncbi:MAG: class I tRNA ligase family protein, partial [Acidimicrobiia bacterium]